MSPLMANGSSMVLGGLFALVHSYFTEIGTQFLSLTTMGFLQGVFMIILISNLVCYNLYGMLLNDLQRRFFRLLA